MEVGAGTDASPWSHSSTLCPSRPLPLGVLRLQLAQGRRGNPDTKVQNDLSPFPSPREHRGALLLHRSRSLSFPRERQGAGLSTLCIVHASKIKTTLFRAPQSCGTQVRPVGKEAHTLRPAVQLGSATVPPPPRTRTPLTLSPPRHAGLPRVPVTLRSSTPLGALLPLPEATPLPQGTCSEIRVSEVQGAPGGSLLRAA